MLNKDTTPLHYSCFIPIVCLLMMAGYSTKAQEDSYHISLRQQLEEYQITGGDWMIGDNEAAAFGTADFYGELTVSDRDADEQPFVRAVRIQTNAAGPSSFSHAYNLTTTAPIQAGDALLMTMWVRNIENNAPAVLEVIFEQNSDAFQKSVTVPFLAKSSSWQQLFIPFKSIDDYDAQEAHLQINVGEQEQTIEIGGIAVLNYGDDYLIENLPEIIPTTEDEPPATGSYYASLREQLQQIDIVGGSLPIGGGEAFTLQQGVGYGAQFSTVTSVGQPFSLARQIVVTEFGPDPFNQALFFLSSDPVQQGDVVLLTFYVRSLSGVGEVEIVLQEQGGEFRNSYSNRVVVGSDTWQRVSIPAVSTINHDAGVFEFQLNVGYREQTLEIGAVSVINYKQEYTIEQLPFLLPYATTDDFRLDSLSTDSGSAGTSVTLFGAGFSTNSVINFGLRPVVPDQTSNDGSNVTFTVPSETDSLYLISATNPEASTRPLPFRVGTGEGPQPPVTTPGMLADFTPPNTWVDGDNFSVRAEVTDASIIETVIVESSPIRQNLWQATTASREGNTSVFSAEVANPQPDELGVQTRVITTSQTGQRDTSDTQYTFRQYTAQQPLTITGWQATGPSQATDADYQLVSVPLQGQLVDEALDELGVYETDRWRIWRLQENQPSEVPYQEFGQSWSGDMQAGEGYMLIFTEGKLFRASGQVVAATNEQPYTITVQPGFNLIGNPYNFPVSWANVLRYNNLDPQALTLKVFQEGFVESDELQPFQGGLVTNPNEGQPLTLAIPIDGLSQTGGRVDDALPQRPAPHWQASFTITSATASAQGSVGMHAEARPGFDPYDDFTPPQPGQSLEVSSYHPDFFLPKFNSDIVPISDQYHWLWEVAAGDPHQTVTMRWNPDEVMGISQLTLVDPQRAQTVDMQQEDHYTFQLNGRGEYSLDIAYGSLDPLTDADKVLVGDVFPNPAANQINTPIRLPPGYQGKLSVRILDPTGRQVGRQTYQDLPAGYHTLVWDVNNLKQSTPTGLYLYQVYLEETGQTFNRRILLK